MSYHLGRLLLLGWLWVFPPTDTFLSDLNRFPPPETVQTALRMNWEHHSYWQGYHNQYEMFSDNNGFYELEGPGWDWTRALDEARKPWDLLDNAQKDHAFLNGTCAPYHLNSNHRYWLKKLKECIGECDYDLGNMPPPLPLGKYRLTGKYVPTPLPMPPAEGEGP